MTDDAPVMGDGQVEVSTPEPEGQGTPVAETEQTVVPPFEERLTGLLDKKKWTKDNWQEQIVNAYGELESKLGSYSELQRKANEFDRLHPEYESAREKARRWDIAQEELARLEQDNKIKTGELDMNTVPTDQLYQLWQRGDVGIGDLPPARQAEVMKYGQAQEVALNAHVQQVEKDLREKHPILADPDAERLIAAQIERGMTDPKTGKELSPEEIVIAYERLVQKGERQAEERIQKDTQMVKNGNLERTSTAVTTTPNVKTKTVADAFRYAKEKQLN